MSSSESPVPIQSVPPPAEGEAGEPRPARRGRRRIVGVALALVVLVGGAFGVSRWLSARQFVATDDAQIEGHLVPVLARVGGYVAAVDIEENQQVKAGEPLVRLDDRDLAARLAQAEADLRAAEAAVGGAGRPGQAPAQLEAARAGVAQASASAQRAESDLRRDQALAREGAISEQQLEMAATTAATTRAQLAAARDQVSAASAGVSAAGGKLAAARAARDQAQLQLSYAVIRAPLDGVLSRKAVELGQLVQPGQQLMTVVPLQDIWVVANLKETQLREVRPGAEAEIKVDTYPHRVFRGRVESISPATGAKFSLLPADNATGNFTKVVQRVPVRIRITGPPDPAAPLRPGMSVTARVRRAHA